MSDKHTVRWEDPRVESMALTRAIVGLATQYGRYGSGYRSFAGNGVEGQQEARGADLAAGGLESTGPAAEAGPWVYDFLMHRTHEGRAFRMLTVIDEC